MTDSNLGIIPSGWETYENVGGTAHTNNVHEDTNILYNGTMTIRIDMPDSSGNGNTESDAFWLGPTSLTLKAGDHLVFIAFIKTSAGSGGRIGIDFYDSNWNRITGTSQADGKPDYTPETGWLQQANYVPVNSGFTQVKIDMIMPATMEADGFGGLAGQYAAGSFGAPVHMIPWLQGVGNANGENGEANGSSWYGGIIIQVNPSGGGSTNMVNRTFSGKLSAVDAGATISGVTVNIAVTGGITDTLIAVTDGMGNYTVTKAYTSTANINASAVASVNADSTNASISSGPATFIISVVTALLKRALTLVVS
jgi:hypothetical protein